MSFRVTNMTSWHQFKQHYNTGRRGEREQAGRAKRWWTSTTREKFTKKWKEKKSGMNSFVERTRWGNNIKIVFILLTVCVLNQTVLHDIMMMVVMMMMDRDCLLGSRVWKLISLGSTNTRLWLKKVILIIRWLKNWHRAEQSLCDA